MKTAKPRQAVAKASARKGGKVAQPALLPPGASKQKTGRHLDIHDGDELDAPRLATWIQTAAVPGWVP